jgi:hypothetical protein
MATFELRADLLDVGELRRLLLEGARGHVLQFIDFDRADARADVAGRLGRIANPERLHLADELVEEFVVDLGVEVHAVVAGAHRAAEEELRRNRRLHGLVDVRSKEFGAKSILAPTASKIRPGG